MLLKYYFSIINRKHQLHATTLEHATPVRDQM